MKKILIIFTINFISAVGYSADLSKHVFSKVKEIILVDKNSITINGFGPTNEALSVNSFYNGYVWIMNYIPGGGSTWYQNLGASNLHCLKFIQLMYLNGEGQQLELTISTDNTRAGYPTRNIVGCSLKPIANQ